MNNKIKIGDMVKVLDFPKKDTRGYVSEICENRVSVCILKTGGCIWTTLLDNIERI